MRSLVDMAYARGRDWFGSPARNPTLLTLLVGALGGCGDDGPSPAPDTNEPLIPLVDEALDGQCAGGRPPGTGVAPGNDLHKVTLTDPDAICNDGTPAIMYIRAANGPAATNRWVIHMQAGGGCSSHDVCFDRWCGIGPYEAAKMSSRFAPPATDGGGLFARNQNNVFGSANQVFLYYCSSDSWSGSRSDAVLDDSSGARPSFRLHFRGHDILEAAATVLATGAVSDDNAQTLPSLTDATEVLFSGSSAGSLGLVQHLDWWRTKAPRAIVGGLLDSFYMPVPEDVDDASVRQSYETGLRASWDQVKQTLYQAYTDESCVTRHPGTDAYLCGLSTHVMLHHLTTPFFVRQDLRDPVSYTTMQPTGATLAQYAAWTHTSLGRVANVRMNSEEGADITLAPGAMSSNCGQHIVAMNNPWFGVAASGNATVETPDGAPRTLHDALTAWVGGTPIQALDTDPSTTSVCATQTNDQ